ncbi:MAG: carbohydrate-binding domain-containing protein [Prevotella sp.]|nr:carbohydrate-binding domain-containing protein [Prevotella sp.]
MRRLQLFLIALVMSLGMAAQTLNVVQGDVTYAFPAAQCGDMQYTAGATCTINGKVFTIADLNQMFIDESKVTDNTVEVNYEDGTAKVRVAGNIARYITPVVSGAHVRIEQSSEVDDAVGEITYTLTGNSIDGEFYMTGSYKATVELSGLTLTNTTPVWSGAAICIMDGKRVALSVKKDTENTLTDAASGDQKAALYCKGHLEFKGKGTLNVYGTLTHAIKSAEYMQMKNCTVNVRQAVKDGISCDEYFLMESGTLTIGGVGDDAIQCDIDGTASTGVLSGHDGEDSGNVYVEGGTLTLTVTADGAKGVKAGGDVKVSGGTITITQSGGLVTTDDDIDYPTSIKADGNIDITGGAITITNTADGGKGMSADGTLTIDESSATTTIDIKANGKGGVAEVTIPGSTDSATSYKVFVSIPTSGGGGPGGPGGGGRAWTNVYLYKSDGTLVQQLTNTVNKSNGYSTTTFYYYDFGAADSDTYYFKSDNYTSRNTTYTIKSTTFSGPTTGEDVYYSITNSYTTSGTTRTYTLSNVTNTYGGTSDVSEDEGTSYNAIGLKADGNLTIGAGTITITNNGAMSKSIKSKAAVTINGGSITLTPSGAMQVINSDASYSMGVKAVDFVQNDGTLIINASGAAGRGVSATTITTNGGTLTITNSGSGQSGSTDDYTAKGLKADTSIKLNAGTISITMTGNGGKGIKSKGTYTQGTADGNGPTLTVSTTGSRFGNSSSGGGGWGGMQQNSGSSAKGIKVQGVIYLYGGTSEVSTKTDGAEGMESKTAIYIEGGKHYYACYDDCLNSSGAIYFNGGVTVCYSNGNDAVDSNYGRTGAITIGSGAVFAFTTRGAPEEGLDCDNNSYIQITGTGIAISAGANQGGGGGWGGSSSSTISNAKQGYYLSTSSLSYSAGRYYSLLDASGNNLVSYSFPTSCNSSLSLFTATGMVKNSKYYIKYNTTEPTDATTAWHGLYIGSSHAGSSDFTNFTAQ